MFNCSEGCHYATNYLYIPDIFQYPPPQVHCIPIISSLLWAKFDDTGGYTLVYKTQMEPTYIYIIVISDVNISMYIYNIIYIHWFISIYIYIPQKPNVNQGNLKVNIPIMVPLSKIAMNSPFISHHGYYSHCIFIIPFISN